MTYKCNVDFMFNLGFSFSLGMAGVREFNFNWGKGSVNLILNGGKCQ